MPRANQAAQLSGITIAREDARRKIAYVVLAAYFGLITLIIVVPWLILRMDTDPVLKVLTTTASVLGGVVGAIVGFYFQSRT